LPVNSDNFCRVRLHVVGQERDEFMFLLLHMRYNACTVYNCPTFPSTPRESDTWCRSKYWTLDSSSSSWHRLLPAELVARTSRNQYMRGPSPWLRIAAKRSHL
jgi:hypothetical protein